MTPAAFVSAFIPRWHSASQRASVASLKSAPPIPRVPVRRRRRLHHASPAMVLTPSTMLPLGTIAPLFSLPEPLSGRTLSIDDVKRDNGLLVIFMCNHCPFVKFVQDLLNQLGTDMKDSNVGMVGISSNDVNDYPDDNAENMAKLASTTFSTFHYLLDETQQVAKSYRAACTPDIYLFDKDLKLVYRYVLSFCKLTHIHHTNSMFPIFSSVLFTNAGANWMIPDPQMERRPRANQFAKPLNFCLVVSQYQKKP